MSRFWPLTLCYQQTLDPITAIALMLANLVFLSPRSESLARDSTFAATRGDGVSFPWWFVTICISWDSIWLVAFNGKVLIKATAWRSSGAHAKVPAQTRTSSESPEAEYKLHSESPLASSQKMSVQMTSWWCDDDEQKGNDENKTMMKKHMKTDT